MKYVETLIPILMAIGGFAIILLTPFLYIGAFLAFAAVPVWYESQVAKVFRQFVAIYSVVLAGVLMIGQVLYGWFEAILVDDLSRILFAGLIVMLFAAGIGLRKRRIEDNFKWFLLGGIAILIPTILISSVSAALDIAGLTSTGASGYSIPPLWGLEALSRVATDVGIIINTITGIIPAIVVVIGVAMIYAGDTPDEYLTAGLEAVMAGGIVFIFVLAFQQIGITLF
jgi:hypothetical protein